MVAGGSVCDDGGVWCMVVENVVYGGGGGESLSPAGSHPLLSPSST